jgi:hypothetical protein
LLVQTHRDEFASADEGVVRHHAYSQADGFAIGTADGCCCASGTSSARACELDGNERFQVTVNFGDVGFVVGDPALIETDELDILPSARRAQHREAVNGQVNASSDR